MISKFIGLGLSDAQAITNDNEATVTGEDEEPADRPRVFFTHVPLELLPKKALYGGVKVGIQSFVSFEPYYFVCSD